MERVECVVGMVRGKRPRLGEQSILRSCEKEKEQSKKTMKTFRRSEVWFPYLLGHRAFLTRLKVSGWALLRGFRLV